MSDENPRRPFVCANWKMHVSASQAETFATTFLNAIADRADVFESDAELAIAPAYPALDRLGGALADSPVRLAAQNFHAAEAGAFTGEVSLDMLIDLGCRYALVGHSERRQLFGEDDQVVADKTARLVGSPVFPILCVGETLEERQRDETLSVVGRQLAAVLDRADGLGDELVVAYEPVWAIGTGETATPDMAQAVHIAIRDLLGDRLGEVGSRIRILYGGSVKPQNARDLLSQPDIDGALVGGASLDPEAFAEIAFACLETAR